VFIVLRFAGGLLGESKSRNPKLAINLKAILIITILAILASLASPYIIGFSLGIVAYIFNLSLDQASWFIWASLILFTLVGTIIAFWAGRVMDQSVSKYPKLHALALAGLLIGALYLYSYFRNPPPDLAIPWWYDYLDNCCTIAGCLLGASSQSMLGEDYNV